MRSTSRRLRRTGALAAITAAAIAGFAPAGASAQGLTGETLLGPFVSEDVSCQPDGTGTFTYSSEGVASGPFPGTYVETGTATVGLDQNLSPVIVDWAADFTIESIAGTIIGQKSFVPGTSFANGGAVCFSDANNQTSGGFVANLVYRTTGAVEDSGLSNASGFGQGLPLQETFTSLTKEACKERARELGFKNQGQCVKQVN